jgi:hypothetical protein
MACVGLKNILKNVFNTYRATTRSSYTWKSRSTTFTLRREKTNKNNIATVLDPVHPIKTNTVCYLISRLTSWARGANRTSGTLKKMEVYF